MDTSLNMMEGGSEAVVAVNSPHHIKPEKPTQQAAHNMVASYGGRDDSRSTSILANNCTIIGSWVHCCMPAIA